MKKLLYLILAVITISVYACQKETSVKNPNALSKLNARKDTTPPGAAASRLIIQKDTTPPGK